MIDRGDVATILSLAKALYGASAEAKRDGFQSMAKLLDECGTEITRVLDVATGRNVASIERAKSCLETWLALREW
jgi:hypothetical protein